MTIVVLSAAGALLFLLGLACGLLVARRQPPGVIVIPTARGDIVAEAAPGETVRVVNKPMGELMAGTKRRLEGAFAELGKAGDVDLAVGVTTAGEHAEVERDLEAAKVEIRARQDDDERPADDGYFDLR